MHGMANLVKCPILGDLQRAFPSSNLLGTPAVNDDWSMSAKKAQSRVWSTSPKSCLFLTICKRAGGPGCAARAAAHSPASCLIQGFKGGPRSKAEEVLVHVGATIVVVSCCDYCRLFKQLPLQR